MLGSCPVLLSPRRSHTGQTRLSPTRPNFDTKYGRPATVPHRACLIGSTSLPPFRFGTILDTGVLLIGLVYGTAGELRMPGMPRDQHSHSHLFTCISLRSPVYIVLFRQMTYPYAMRSIGCVLDRMLNITWTAAPRRSSQNIQINPQTPLTAQSSQTPTEEFQQQQHKENTTI